MIIAAYTKAETIDKDNSSLAIFLKITIVIAKNIGTIQNNERYNKFVKVIAPVKITVSKPFRNNQKIIKRMKSGNFFDFNNLTI